MSRKFKVTAVAILVTLIFATMAFAGIFDVVGAVVGGVLGVQAQPTQAQIENFHKDYLNKVAAKIKKNGNPDAAFQDVIDEQKKLGYTVSVVQTDTGQIKSFDITGNGMTVIVKSVVDRDQQLMTISYTDLQGNPTGNVLTKKYELPGGAAVASAPSDDGPSPFANTKQSDNPFANATPTANPFANAGRNQEIEKAFSAKVASDKSSGIVATRHVYVPSITGCAAFDNSMLKGNKKIILNAYYGAGKKMTTGDFDSAIDRANSEISRIANAKDPFAYDTMFGAFKSLLKYYQNGGTLDLYVYTVIDIQTPIKGTCFHVTTRNYDERNVYNTRTQNLVVNPIKAETSLTSAVDLDMGVFDCDYQLQIPIAAAKKAYEKIAEITAKNNAVSSAKSPNGKITSLRICYAFDTPAGGINDYLPSGRQKWNNSLVFKNVTFKILAVENEYGKNNNTNWYPIVSGTGSNCVVIK